MALNFYELAKSRPVTQSVDSANVTVKFIAFYSSSETAVASGLLAVAPVVFDGLARQRYSLDPLGAGMWMCDVEYSFSSNTQTDAPGAPTDPTDATALGPEYSFDLTAGTVHVTQSLATVLSRHKGDPEAGPTTAPNYAKAIGVTKDRVEGVDIFAPKFEFTITNQVYPLTLVDVRRLRSITAKTNNAPWRGFATGELMYMGASGTCQPGNVWKLNHKFAAGENLTSVVVSPAITIPTKGAWQYLWCTYTDAVDANTIIQIPQNAYLEQVYKTADFTTIGVGA